MSNLSTDLLTPDTNERVVLGIDTGLKIDYVIGGIRGLFFHGNTKNYDELDGHMKRWPKAIAVIDQGGDLIGCRQFAERWKGRVYLCLFSEDRKTKELVRWGQGDEHGAVTADRNRMIQLVVDEFSERLIPLQGDENDWHEYWMDWNNLSRIRITDSTTQQFKGFKWVRNGRDHLALATVYWRVGMSKFGWGGTKRIKARGSAQRSPVIQDASGNFKALPYVPPEKQRDWRD